MCSIVSVSQVQDNDLMFIYILQRNCHNKPSNTCHNTQVPPVTRTSDLPSQHLTGLQCSVVACGHRAVHCIPRSSRSWFAFPKGPVSIFLCDYWSFMYLIWGTNIFRYFAQFLIGLFVFLSWVLGVLHVFPVKVFLSDIWFVNIVM